MKVLFIEYPKCSTCRKAKKWLEENNINFTDRHIVEQKPTKEEICHSIEHFCMDHSIDCICVTRRDRILYKIDGELYQTKIQEDHLDQPSYWMIICFLSR